MYFPALSLLEMTTNAQPTCAIQFPHNFRTKQQQSELARNGKYLL